MENYTPKALTTTRSLSADYFLCLTAIQFQIVGPERDSGVLEKHQEVGSWSYVCGIPCTTELIAAFRWETDLKPVGQFWTVLVPAINGIGCFNLESLLNKIL